MSWKTIAALLVLAAGLGGFFYYDTYHLGPAREKAESAKGRLWTIEPKDVEAFTIKRKEDTIRVKRVEGGWEMLEPVTARGDRGSIEELVTTLATARVDREIDPNPARPAQFGLEPPEAEITLEVKGRSEPLGITVGGRSPTGAWVYAREKGKPAVITLPEGVLRDVQRPVVEFRDKTVVAFDRKRVSGLDLDIEGERISLEAQAEGRWRIARPGPYKADADLVNDLLDKLESARARDFAAESPTSLARWGLDRPARLTIWTGKDKERASTVLLFGRLDAGRKGVYVMRGGDSPVMLVGEELWKAVPKTVAALRDKVVLAYAYDKVSRVELQHARGTVTLERDGSSWKITAPEALKADPGAINGLLWKIRDLRATAFLGETAADIPRYLPKPEVTVRLWEEGAKEPKTLLLGASSLKRAGQAAAVAAVEGQGPVVLVDARALEDLAKTAADLRDRSLFPAFEMKDVHRARVTAGGKRLVVERKGEDWRVLEPSRGLAREFKVSNLLLALKALRWKEMVSPKGDEATRFGLDKPEIEVALQKADGSELGTLLVGRQEGGVAYVKVTGAPTIYSVETKALEDLRRAPTEIPE